MNEKNATLAIANNLIIVNDADSVLQHLQHGDNSTEFHLLNDNCSTELFTDLVREDFFLSNVL